MPPGVEDALAVRCLETGRIPPVANFKEIDPELGIARDLRRTIGG